MDQFSTGVDRVVRAAIKGGRGMAPPVDDAVQIATQESSYRDPGVGLSRSSAERRTWHGLSDDILAIEDPRHAWRVAGGGFCPGTLCSTRRLIEHRRRAHSELFFITP